LSATESIINNASLETTFEEEKDQLKRSMCLNETAVIDFEDGTGL
jgi:hypothetical protein